MSLFCIPAAYQKLQDYSKLIFDVTIKCMDLYSKKFGLDYPFNKYDQIFIREFGAFAM
jgi:aminopeptidase N